MGWLLAKLGRARHLTRVLGPHAALTYAVQRSIRATKFKIHPKCLTESVLVRGKSSDPFIFNQIFVEREYACLDDLTDVRLVIDCGAYVGFSSAYFLSRFSKSFVIAIEPDPQNFAMLSRNLVPYGDRARLLQAAVWPHETRLELSKDVYRSGVEATRQVQEASDGDIRGVDIGMLLSSSGAGRISILKIDVEGAEALIFSENYKPWLSKVDTLVIELHDDSSFGNSTQTFYAAIQDQEFQISHSGELTVCRRI